MNTPRKYQFHWELLGNIELGRPHLGDTISLRAYRLMQFCFRDVLEERFGAEEADRIFYAAGQRGGQHFAANVLGKIDDFHHFIKRLQEALKELGIGIMRVEEADLEAGSFILTVSEDADCSGLPELDYEICTFDEGFIAALMESFTGRPFEVKEIDCWCTGDRTCRFRADAIG
jgi:uncharacterized protein